MAQKSIIIIGGGIAGLAAGCYGQMNGYKTRIFEMQDKPGGLCTSWQRQGYTIDGCIRWLVGTAPGSSYYKIWEELGAISGRQFVYPDEFIRVEGDVTNPLVLFTNIDRTEQYLIDLSPKDKILIKDFIQGIHACGHFEIPIEKPLELYGFVDRFKLRYKLAPFMKSMKKWLNLSLRDFAAQFTSPFLREAFCHVWFPEFSVIFIQMSLALLSKKVAGYPVGGSLAIARALEKRYLALGGKIVYGAQATKIMVKRNMAYGVRFADGTEDRADYVISAGDGHQTIFKMIEPKYVDAKIKSYYESLPIVNSVLHIALGVNRLFEHMPNSAMGLNFPLDKPETIGERQYTRLPVYFYNFDPTLAPRGKTLLSILLPADYKYWQDVRNDLNGYRSAKEQIAEKIINIMARRFPGFNIQVEMVDIATPATFYRYTGNWQGSIGGWAFTPQNWNVQIPKTLPKLKNLYMCGHWVQGLGVPSAALSGRHCLQVICRRDRKNFTTTK